MTGPRESFSHGYGALLRAAASLRNRLLIGGVCIAIAGGASGYAVHHLLVDAQDREFIGWRMEARVRSFAPTASMRRVVFEHDGTEYAASPAEMLAWAPGIEAERRAAGYWKAGGILGGFAGLLFAVGLIKRIRSKGDTMTNDRHLRGAQVMEENEFASKAREFSKKAGEDGMLAHLGGVPIPRHLESRNFLIGGTVGAGKTTAIRQLVDAAERRGESAVIYDPSGDLVAAYYNEERGDVILNPYDARAAQWDLFGEVESWTDAKLVADSLAQPPQGQRADEWLGFTRQLLADVLWKLKQTNAGTLEELLRVVGVGERDWLAEFLDDTPSRRLFEAGAERATASVLFGLPGPQSVIASLRKAPGSGGVFSWAEWARQLDAVHGCKPWVFLGSPERQFPTMRPLISAWINFAAANVLSLAPSRDRRVWLMVDEFASLPHMEAVPRLAAQGRKFGAALVIGIQSPSQLQEVYGHEGAASLAANAGTQLILRMPGGDAARWATAQLGRQEIERRQASDVYETQEAADTSTLVVTREVRDLVLDTEIAGLPDLEGFMRVPSVGMGKVVIPTDHLMRAKRSAAMVPVDPQELWISGLPRPRKDTNKAAPSEAAEAENVIADDMGFGI